MDKQLEKIYAELLTGKKIVTDSRKVENTSIFFALKGDFFDGNNYALDALNSGASYAVVDNPSLSAPGLILVDDVLLTLQKLALYHRDKFNIPVIGITGTNGKTTTKELIRAVLAEKYNVLATEGNLNNHIGVPLMLLSLNAKHDIAVIEMGANHINEIADLCKIVKPTHGIITNIGKAHLEGFKDLQGVITAKRALYDFISQNDGQLFVNKDDALLIELSQNVKRIFYSSVSESGCFAESVSSTPFVNVKCRIKDAELDISSNLFGGYNVNNILAALCIGEYFDVDKNLLVKAIANYVPSNNRSQFLKTHKNSLFLDAYNANPSSMELAIKEFAHLDFPNKILVIGDMRELGKYSFSEHKRILDIVVGCGFKSVFLVGEEFEKANSFNYKSFSDVNFFKSFLLENPIKDASIFIKGSRGVALEKIIDLL